MKIFYEFIKNTNDVPYRHGELIKLAVKRHIKDLDNSKDDNYLFYFDENAAQRAINFIRLCRHTKGKFAGQLFNLQPFQAFIAGCLFGWLRKSDNLRRFSKAYIEIARKNGKTEFAAAIGNYLLFGDNEFGAEIYSAATKRDQAKICFTASQNMLKLMQNKSKHLRQNLKIYRSSTVYEPSQSTFKTLSQDYLTEDGLNPHGGIIDEFHAWPNDGLLKVLESGTGARTQALILIITTAGVNSNGPCGVFRDKCIQYLNNVLQNDTTFVAIFSIDEKDDWTNTDVWYKANPNLGQSPLIGTFKTQFLNATTEGITSELEFKIKNLNIWTNSLLTWIPQDVIKKCRSKRKNIKKNAFVTGALDLSATRDITSFTLFDGKLFQTWYFIPEDRLKEIEYIDGINYKEMVNKGYLITTGGNIVDQRFIKNHILKLAEKYNIMAIAYDRWNSSQVVIELQDEGLTMLMFGQGFQSMSAPTKQLEVLIFKQKVKIVLNSVTEWMFSNVSLSYDPTLSIKVDKKKSKNKVDGVVTMVMALAVSMSPKYKPSGYEK